jgi:predicted ATP-grasp superfamily ATP-dependent carboligase
VTTYAVARNQEALGRHTALVVPPFEAFDLVANKSGLLRRAAACGIPIPRTHFVDGLEGLNAVIDQVEYPAVVKPARSKTRTDRGWVPTVVQYAHSRTDLTNLYQRTTYLASYPSLIQERIVGPGMGVFVLCDHGQLVATFAHRRVRERPPSGGQGVLCESVALAPQLRDEAMRLLGPLGWHGVAMLEYKQDCRTGQSVLMEVNGRFWGSLQLAVDAGVDFPYLSYQLARGWALDLPDSFRIGVRSRWLLGDLDHLLLRLFRSGRDLPDSAPSKLQTLADFARSGAFGPRNEVFKRDDPGPAVRELWQYTKALSASATRQRPELT